jgi:hypothetical protein
MLLVFPLLTGIAILGVVVFLALRAWIGDALAGLVFVVLIALLLFGNRLRFERRPRRERSP